MSESELKKAKHKFQIQRWHAIYKRSIEWKLTFDEWLNWWLSSGHWSERGVGQGRYCMARKGDKGAYALDNIECKRFEDNASEGLIGRVSSNKGKPAWNRGMKMSAEYCAKLVESHRGKTLTPEHRAKIAEALRGRKASATTRAKQSKAAQERAAKKLHGV